MPILVSPLFWEWFNIWLIQFLKDLYHEIKMVALRGTNNSLNTLSHACVNHGNRSQQSTIELAQSLQTSFNMPQSIAQHINANQINLQSLNNVAVQFIPQQTNANSLKPEQSSSRFSNSNCMLPSHRYRLLTQARPVECYHPSGAAGAAYMPSTAGGAQPSAQAAMRVQPTPQPSAPPAPQQDMSKTTMAGHSYVSQNQTPQPRPPYTNFQYRAPQHGTRPNTHPRQQQSFIPSGTATATGPVVYPTLVFQPTPMGMQTYQQPRSSTPGYFPYVGHYIGYNTQPSHTPPYYYTPNSPQLPAPSLQTTTPGGRNNATTLVGPQGTPATPTPPTATLTHPQAHMHPTMPGIRPPVQKRQSHRVPIIDPVTQQDIFSDLYSNDNFLSSESNDRQTPQPDHSVVQEFNRLVNEAANQPSCDSALKSNYVNTKSVEAPVSSATNSVQIQPNAISSVNNNIVKSDLLTVNETKSLGPDVAVVASETPIVSAISDSPVIVPKMPTINKQLQKNSDQNVQSLVVDTNKNIPPTKQIKQSNNVPQVEDFEKQPDNVNVTPIATVAPIPCAVVVTATGTLAPAPVTTTTTPSTQTPIPTPAPVPQPQRIREPRERVKSEDKEKSKDRESQEKEAPSAASKPNGPTPVAISSVDSLSEAINLPTSQSNQAAESESLKKQVVKQALLAPEPETSTVVETDADIINKREPVLECPPTATQLLSASIEKVAKEQLSAPPKAIEVKEASSGIEAQAKLTQSISSVLRSNQPESKMKDINLNNKATDPDTANGNPTEVTKTETVKEDINKNEKGVKNSKNTNKKSNKMPNNEVNTKEPESYENGKNETDKVVSNVEKDKPQSEEMTTPKLTIEEPENAEQSQSPAKFVPKYKYSEDQWSPLNKEGKKYYDIGLLKQIKDDPLSKNKPNAPLLEACNVIRTTPMQEPQPFTPISRPINDSLFPPFAKSPGMGSRNNTPRDAKKDSRNMPPSGKGSVKLNQNPNSNNPHKPIYVSLSLREEVKLNEVDSAWKPTRFRKENLDEEEVKTQELYKKFRGILNKLTPQKFDTLLDRVKTLEINNQKRLEGVIDLVFEKAIDEPNFSEAYAAMCNKLSMLKVPADNATSPEHFVNFRALIINKCQNQFEANKVDEQVMKLEKELADCTDPAKKKEVQLMLNEENRRARMRSVGNVRFIGELYKLKMLTSKIMDYCMKYLIDKVEEEKLECLCKLLTTIGEQVENEVHGQLDAIFKKMQEIVDRKSNKISSRVRFMLQDVIELRKRKWVAKTVIDSQPKMMDQIQKEAEQHQRHIELMNANPMGGGFRRDEGGRGKRGDNRRQNSNNSFMDSSWKSTKTTNFPVDTSKLKAVTQKNLTNIKLAPHNSAWNHGSGTKTTAQASSNPMFSLSKNMYSVLEHVQTDPTSIRANKDMTPSYHSKGASIERSTFNSRGDISSGGGSRSGSVGMARSNSGTRSTSGATPAPVVPQETAAPAPAPVPQEPLPDNKKKSVKSMIDLCFINPDDDEMVAEVKQYYPAQYHAAVVTEILNVALEKSAKENGMLAQSLLHLVSTGTISSDNFAAGMKEILAFTQELYIDIPMLYDNLGKIIAPQIEKKHITFVEIFRLCDSVISANHGHLLLKAILREMKESMGPSFVKSKWQESEIQFNQWMDENQVAKWLEDNKLEFLEGDSKACEETKKILTPAQTQTKLIQLMNADESPECIKGWLQDNFGKSTNEDWFMRALIQAICEHALFGSDGRDVPHFNQDRMNKYVSLIHDFGETKQSREASCLFGIQQLIHALEHPQGLTLEVFQFLHEQYVISLDGFTAWEVSEKEPEGKGVMMKALTSFFTNIKEADNEDSCSED